jgi:hypothetical protein
VVSGITEITHITSKSDMSRWTRAHADSPGINWSVYPGPGGTMIIVEHEQDRCTLTASQAAAMVAPELTAGVSPDVVTSASVEAASEVTADTARTVDNGGIVGFAASA